MKTIAIASVVVVLLAGATVCLAQELPKPPGPVKQHEWLQQFVGEWETEAEMIVEPGKPPVTCKGTESVRAIGGFWIVAEGKASFMEMPVQTMLTLGYDSQKKKYVGTWVDSMQSYLWNYEGTVDSSGKILPLLTEGPNPAAPGKRSKFKDEIEFKSKDHRTLTSSMQEEDGKWVSFMTVNYRRKK